MVILYRHLLTPARPAEDDWPSQALKPIGAAPAIAGAAPIKPLLINYDRDSKAAAFRREEVPHLRDSLRRRNKDRMSHYAQELDVQPGSDLRPRRPQAFGRRHKRLDRSRL